MGIDLYESLEDIAKIKAQGNRPHLGIGRNCHIENVIIDKNCAIGNNVTIIGSEDLLDIETETYCIKDGYVILKEGAVIPDGMKIGKITTRKKRVNAVMI
jgi:glucose-1-phosphate adenylyltransferase